MNNERKYRMEIVEEILSHYKKPEKSIQPYIRGMYEAYRHMGDDRNNLTPMGDFASDDDGVLLSYINSDNIRYIIQTAYDYRVPVTVAAAQWYDSEVIRYRNDVVYWIKGYNFKKYGK